ncbi:spermatogenesis-associated protein 7 isoform X2 [Talpa occidentalis]|uniref:spermatogenesis-associated protein 7 isoform X2 n=1 Tax=Talpa occidentalis TaxID=50954 RepID=UPI00188F9CD8|nr:spermatogenesis-associated protein 7 isoform X2 [Talpa occidentalis]
MDGSRRVRATSVLPRYGPPCLFKGHLSTKSNAFCTDSSSLRLSTLHLVKNHMAIHYNKILSAKAAVDCSVPLSMSASIKYADQQRREKLKKELARCEKELKLTKTAVQTNSKNNSKSLFTTFQKPSGEPQEEDVFIEEVNGFSSFTRSPVTSSEKLHISLPKPDKVFTNDTEKNSSSFLSSMDCTISGPRKPCSGPLCGRAPRSTFPNAHRFQLVISKTPSGDLLDKHSELFSNRHLPFTPRTLKTEAKSFLSQYRYYTPAKRKKDFTDQRVEAETQTELSSFKSDFDTLEIKNFADSGANINQVSSCMNYEKEKMTPLPVQGHNLPWGEGKDGALQHSSRTICQYSLEPPTGRKVYSDDEELLYLSFIEDITDEILKLGLFSNRFLEQLFERHIKQNKHHLEEGKMRHLLHILKLDLGCVSKENAVKLDDVDNFNLLDFENTGNSEQNECKNEQNAIQLERQEYKKALDMLLSLPKEENEVSSPNEFYMPIYKSKFSDEVEIQQVNDETNHGPAIWDEKSPDNLTDSFTDPETDVNVIEGESDTEKVETANELCCLSMALAQTGQLCAVGGDGNHDMEQPTLKITEMSIEDCPVDV